MSMVKEFKEFALKGNVLDLAVAVIIGGAFGGIVSSLINDIIMPVVGMAGNANFKDLYLPLSDSAKSAATAFAAANPGFAGNKSSRSGIDSKARTEARSSGERPDTNPTAEPPRGCRSARVDGSSKVGSPRETNRTLTPSRQIGKPDHTGGADPECPCPV